MDGQKVYASDYYKDRLTLVICWASWCAPCIREANDIIPLYNQYRDRGLNVFSLAHEFKSTDAMRKAVERDGTIIAVPNSVEEFEQQLQKIFKKTDKRNEL